MLSNCHGPETIEMSRKMKDGTNKTFTCKTITRNLQYHGWRGFDRTKISVHELDRKSNKWWQKVFIRLRM